MGARSDHDCRSITLRIEIQMEIRLIKLIPYLDKLRETFVEFSTDRDSFARGEGLRARG